MEAPAVVDKILRDVGNVNDTAGCDNKAIGLPAAVYWQDGLVAEIVHYYDKKVFESNGHRPNCGKEIISFNEHAEYKWRVTSLVVATLIQSCIQACFWMLPSKFRKKDASMLLFFESDQVW